MSLSAEHNWWNSSQLDWLRNYSRLTQFFHKTRMLFLMYVFLHQLEYIYFFIIRKLIRGVWLIVYFQLSWGTDTPVAVEKGQS